MQAAGRVLAALFFAGAGIGHFLAPDRYAAIVPPALPWPLALVYLSGIAEIAGGVGLLLPATRRLAAAGLIVLLCAVFPANVYAAQVGMRWGGSEVPEWILWARLPLQALLICWIYAVGWKNGRESATVKNE